MIRFIACILPYVAHRLTASSLINFGKLSEDIPCGILKINRKGFYEGGENGAYYLWHEEEPSNDVDPSKKKKKKKEGVWLKLGPFALLNTIMPELCSRKVVNIPYHSDIGFKSTSDSFNIFPCFKADFLS